jgi:hypothetical protein
MRGRHGRNPIGWITSKVFITGTRGLARRELCLAIFGFSDKPVEHASIDHESFEPSFTPLDVKARP